MQAGRQDHELKAVLVADIEGYARLMAEHEDEVYVATSRCLDLFKESIPEFRGTLIKTTGDGVMVEFPSATAAVQYGIDIQKRLQELNSSVSENHRPHFRIGVHLGEVIHEGGDIYGHSVNVAARIEQFAEPDGVCVSELVYSLVRHRLQIGFEFIGGQKLKNVDAPVDIYRVRENLKTAVMPPAMRKLKAPLDVPERPSIVVLPFLNLSASTESEFFSDGVTEDIITSLSKFEDLFVIARHSSFVYKGKSVSTQDVAREFGVRYVLEGSIRIAGDRLRVTAKLIDGATAHHLWAERYDRKFQDIFDVQDDVTQVIVSTLAAKLLLTEASRRSEMQTGNLNAYSDLLQGRERLLKYTEADNAKARELFESSLSHDPKYAPACAAMARSYNYDWQFSWGRDPDNALDEAVMWATKAVSLDRSSARAHAELGFTMLFKKSPAAAIRELRQALDLNPNDADIMAELSDALTYNGQMEEAVKLLQLAMRLNPYHPDWYLWYLGDAYYALRRYEDAIEALERMTNPVIGCRLFAASHAQLGDVEKASFHAKQVLTMQPDFSVDDWVRKQPEVNPAETQHLAEGLKKAGLPD